MCCLSMSVFRQLNLLSDPPEDSTGPRSRMHEFFLNAASESNLLFVLVASLGTIWAPRDSECCLDFRNCDMLLQRSWYKCGSDSVRNSGSAQVGTITYSSGDKTGRKSSRCLLCARSQYSGDNELLSPISCLNDDTYPLRDFVATRSNRFCPTAASFMATVVASDCLR